MKAVVKIRPGIGNVEYLDVPEPVCGPNQVKIEIRYCGICGTDVHVYYERFKNYPPVILGHEFSGVVVETGAGVERVKPGERVTVLPSSARVCGECEYCRQGYYMFCPIRRGMGHGVDGSFTSLVTVRQDMVYHLPDHTSFEEGAMAEPFASAVQPMEDICGFNVGDTVLLSGPGPIGLFCLLLLKSHRAKVIVAGAEPDTLRLELAGRLGADVVVNVSKEDLDRVVDRETNGRGVDIAVESAGAAASVHACLRAVRELGRYVQVGINGREIPFPIDTILYKQLTVLGSVGHTLKTWERVMRIFDQRTVDLMPIMTHKLPMACWREGFDLCENKQGVKVLLYP